MFASTWTSKQDPILICLKHITGCYSIAATILLFDNYHPNDTQLPCKKMVLFVIAMLFTYRKWVVQPVQTHKGWHCHHARLHWWITKLKKPGKYLIFNLVTNLTIPSDQMIIIWQLGLEKNSKHINMGSSFKDVVVTKPTVKCESGFRLMVWEIKHSKFET
jgi:hypothetical protein